ncbi:PKD domain-containing protein [Candidatus Poribacteria bacterium]|nr:PKD domain-containing protein [Candidatus Poribacteria bacterium]
MRMIVVLWALLFAIIGCGDESPGGDNNPPVVDHLIVPEEVNPGDSVELQVVAHDGDGDVLTYVWDVEKGKLDSERGQTVKWTVPSDLKAATVTVSVNDGVNEPVIEIKRVPIRLENSAPVIQEIVVSDRVHAVSSVELQAVVEDADGDTLTYSWDVPKGLLDSEEISTPTWTAPIELGIVNIRLTVADRINEPVTKSASVLIIHGLIVAGEEAAGIRLGDDFDRVKAIYGKPSRREDARFEYWDPDFGLSGVLDGINRVEVLLLSRPNKAKTAGEVGIGSTQKRVEEEFGGAEEIEKDRGTHWYWKRGIAFTYDADARVMLLFVFVPIGAAPAGFDDGLPPEQVLEHRAALERYYSTSRFERQ